MLFQETIPNSLSYMIAGYIFAFLAMALYIASIYLRARNLDQDRAMLEEMDKPAPPPPPSPQSQPRKSPAKRTVNKSAKSVTKKSRQK